MWLTILRILMHPEMAVTMLHALSTWISVHISKRRVRDVSRRCSKTNEAHDKIYFSFIELSAEFCHLKDWKAEIIPSWKRAEKYLLNKSSLSPVSSWAPKRIQSVQGLCMWMKRMSAHNSLAQIFQTCLVQWVPSFKKLHLPAKRSYWSAFLDV